MPTTVVYDFMFQRGQIGRGSAAAILMLLALVVVHRAVPDASALAATSAMNRRWLVYVLLFGLAAFFLTPLVVVVLTSLRPNEEMAQRSLIGWPQAVTLANYAMAWSHFCIAERCVGVAPYLANSLLMTVPATLISTLLGAVAGSRSRCGGSAATRDIRTGDAGRVPARADAVDPVGDRAAGYWAVQQHCRAGGGARGAGA